jgi:broad specificity phosphatase PhoE
MVERELGKNFSVGDVHVASAGGDDDKDEKKKKKKPEPPISVAYEFDHRMKVDRDREAAEVAKLGPLGSPRTLGSDGFDPNTATFDTHGSSNEAFDWWVQQVKAAEADQVNKLKLKQKTSLEATPNELKALTEALNSNPLLRSALQQALAASIGKAADRTITVIRHGATHLNNKDTSVDRVRGWTNVPLSQEGRDEAQKLADKMAKEPPDHLVTSDLNRAHETAKMIAKATGKKIDDVSEGFRPWNVGEYAGKTSKEAVPILCRYAIEKPDEKIPGGESFNDFRGRFFKALAGAVAKFSGRLAVVTHHRGERLLSAWQAAGFPADGTIDGKEFSKKGEGTAGYEDLEIPPDRLDAAAQATVTKWINPPEDFNKIWEGGDDIPEADEDWFKRAKLVLPPAPIEKTMTFNIAKVDDEQQIFYGWAYVSEENGSIIVDKQDDYILPEDLLSAAEDFTLQGGKLGDMHDKRNVGRVVASFVTTEALCKTFGISMADERRGWILGFKVDNPEVWKKIKDGEQLELSIGGKGERVEVELTVV